MRVNRTSRLRGSAQLRRRRRMRRRTCSTAGLSGLPLLLASLQQGMVGTNAIPLEMGKQGACRAVDAATVRQQEHPAQCRK